MAIYKTNIQPLEENFIFSEDNLYVNFDKFKSGKSNILLITGLSGSGKTTLAKELAEKYNATRISIDEFEQVVKIYDNINALKANGNPVIADYLDNNQDTWLNSKKIFERNKNFIDFVIDYAKKNKKNKYIMEGVQIYEVLDTNKKEYKDIPIIFVGSSAVKSLAQRMKRNYGYGVSDLIEELKDLPNIIRWYINSEKSLNNFKVALVTESSIKEENNMDYITEVDKVVNGETQDLGEGDAQTTDYADGQDNLDLPDDNANEQQPDDGTDYTQGQSDVLDDDPNNDNMGMDDPNAGGQQQPAEDQAPEKSKLQDLEMKLFTDLSPEQLNIKHRELKQQYIDLYTKTEELIDRVNAIPKTDNNLSVVDFIVKKLTELREIINYYLVNVYSTKTYVENTINIQHYLTIIASLNKMLNEIKPEDKE